MPRTFHCPTTREFRSFTRSVWGRDRWQRGQPKRTIISSQRRALSCSNRKGSEKRIWRRYKRQFYLYRMYRGVAPYPGFQGEGMWLTYLPIPSYIVACETRGSTGDGRWLARNPSGAQGPAQLLGWPAPYPAMTDHERLRYWRVTRMVWETSGPGAWSCA